MTVLRAGDIDRFLSKPDPKKPVVLIYGPDTGLVSERAAAVLKLAGGDNADAFSNVQLEGDAIASDPGLLLDEAQTIGLFGNRRVIRVRAGGKNFAPALDAILKDPPEATIVIEAGELRPTSPLRAACEKSHVAAVIPCYIDTERDLVQLFDRSGLQIDREARDELIALLGADRLASRAEIEKLVLYAGKEKIGVEDVRAVIADASALEIDDVVDSAAAGESKAALTALRKAYAAGTTPATVLNAAARHIANLHRLRLVMDQGESPSGAVEHARPPIFFRRKPKFERALNRLSTESLASELAALSDASLAARKNAALAQTITERAILRLARSGKPAPRRA